MRLSGVELQHVHRVLSCDIGECTDMLEADIPEDRVPAVAARMEGDRRLLERIEEYADCFPEVVI